VPQGTGSGFVWDKKGHIVTNYHVIEGADLISVSFDSKTALRARVVGTSPDKDLAVLKIEAPPDTLHPIRLGRSGALQVGMEALAIGNPFGLDHSLTRGIISATGREIRASTGRVIENVLQTDAAINPGNSGGPLLNSRGDLIGVNTAIVSRSGSSSGIGFAVPVSTVRRVVPQLIQFGKVVRPALGVYLFGDEIARQWGIRKGVVIRHVVPGSSAAKAGLEGAKIYNTGEVELGDIIVHVADKEVVDTDDLLNELERHRVGDEVEVGIQRGSEVRKVKVRLQDLE
jgi:S1-C subfamily serine protease